MENGTKQGTKQGTQQGNDIQRGVVGEKVDNMLATHAMLTDAESEKAAKQIRFALTNYISETIGDLLKAKEDGREWEDEDPFQIDAFEDDGIAVTEDGEVIEDADAHVGATEGEVAHTGGNQHGHYAH